MSRYTQIDDNYISIEQVVLALNQAGLESTSLIVGIDFTKSNERNGAVSFNNKSLHHIGEVTNPYELAVTVIGETLSSLNNEDTNLIPCFGFGDETTVDEDVFSFYSDQRPCNGIEEVLDRYRELVPQVRLAGPTSFAPIIETAIDIVENSGRRYHVLLIIADGQVTRSSNTGIGQLSRQEQETIDAIVKASEYPLSIVLVGVGDGPWDMMKEFDNNIPHRTFDNFQFVNLTEILIQDISIEQMHSEIALALLMEIPSQYLATLELQGLRSQRHERWRSPLPPPINLQQSPLPFPTGQQSRDYFANSGTSSNSRSAEDTREEVVSALTQAGLESTRLIVGIDFTKSNERNGAVSFNNKSLHHIGEVTNPYELAVTVIGGTLSALNNEDTNLIPCFGFGDETTVDEDVFSFYSDQRPCNGIEEVLDRYRELVPQVCLAGPTSFAPIIETAIDIVENSGRRYHVLLIIADGQVTRSSNTGIGQLSRQEQETIDAIVKASEYPLSIVLVGVGDGPWDMMEEFDNNIPHRTFDNFQFVNLTEILIQDISIEQMHSEIALALLMEIPSQYLATLELQGLRSQRHERWRSPLPPPISLQQSPLPFPTGQQSRDYFANSGTSSNSRSAEDTREEVVSALTQAGLESTSLIVGIDFTKSNERNGAVSFNNKSLHHIGEVTNPYELAVTVIGETLSALNNEDTNLIPCFGFGDETTVDEDVFSFYSDQRPCNGIEEVLDRYRELVPQVCLAGPTSFAPIIETAIDIVENSGRRYHVLLIIADGQVTRSSNTGIGQLSRQEQETIDAIVKASEYPLSIVLVGVGDGPWDMMEEFDNNIPHRTFDNFQFVNLTEILSQDISIEQMHSKIALAALMEIPSQYLATLELQGPRHRHERWRNPLPPPINLQQSPLPFPTGQQSRDYFANSYTASSSRSAEDTREEVVCPICLENSRDLAFGCGHLTCQECGRELSLCPICRSPISISIKIYS